MIFDPKQSRPTQAILFRQRRQQRCTPALRKLGASRFACLLATAFALLSAQSASAVDPFTIAVIGDTQSYLANNGQHIDYFNDQTDWIVDNEQSSNIRFVSHVGDIVEDPSDLAEWAMADAAMSDLDPTGIAWSVNFGNHETTTGEPGGSPAPAGAANYLSTFNPSRFASKSWHGGASSNSLNTWQRFTGGNRTFLHLSLEFDAPDDTLAWAQSVINLEENQGLPTLVTTHVYLNDNRGFFNNGSKTIVRRQNTPYDPAGTGRNSAEAIWNDFISNNRQIFMTFNGHVQGERLLVSENDFGDQVWQMQVDYSRRPNGGNGWTKLLEFDLDNDQIHVQTYSPSLDQFALVEPDAYLGLPVADQYTGGADTVGDGDTDFLIDLDFDDERFTDNGVFVFGDLNSDEQITFEDWLIFSGHHLTSFPTLTPIEAYARGDLDSDFDNDEFDYAIFKTLYDDENGSGAFNAMLSSVPEPNSLGLSLLAFLGILGAKRKLYQHSTARGSAILPSIGALLLLVLTESPASADPFTIVVLGDTQSYVESEELTKHFTSQIDWIKEHACSRQIRFVSHVGDIVNDADSKEQWRRANRAMTILDECPVVWSTAFGNHEWNIQSRDLSLYLANFGPERHRNKSWFGGASKDGLSTYQTFTAAGRTFLHLAIQYDAPDETIAWAQKLLNMKEHKSLPTLVTTHVYLNDNRGHFSNGSKTVVQRQSAPYTPGAGRNSAEHIWRNLIAKNDQIFMTFNGHVQGERLLVSRNEKDRNVWQIQVDYSRRPNGGNGWLKLVTFDPAKSEVRIQTYSPTLDEFAQTEPTNYLGRDDEGLPVDHYTDASDTSADGDANYVIPLNFEERFSTLTRNHLAEGCHTKDTIESTSRRQSHHRD